MPLFTDGCYQCAPAEALIAKVLAGRCTMHYTRVAVGNGSIPEGNTPATMTEPAGYVMDAKLSGVTNPVDGECQVTAQITSDDVTADFSATGVLLYAEDPDLGEVPYTYLVLEASPEPIKSKTSTVGKIAIFELVAAVGAVDNVTADIDLETLVTVEKVSEMIAAHNVDEEAHPDIRQIAQDALDQVEALTHTISTIPTQNGSLTYTGSPQSPSWNGYDPATLTLGGTTEATDAGTYTATFTPKDDYQWADGTKDPKSVQWSIGRANIASVPTQTGSLTYNGNAQSPTWSGYDASKMTLGGTTSGTNAGSYAATFTPKANYQWTDGTTAAKEAAWTIGRATVSTLPSQSGSLTYTGSAQSPAWANYDTAKLTIGGATSGTNAGTYTATFTPTSNYQWDGGGIGPQSVNWSIRKAAGSLTLNRSSLTLNNATRTGTITVTRPGNGTITASSNRTSIATVSVSGNTVTVTAVAYGTATITINVAEGTNYTAPSSKTCSVTVNLFNDTLNSNTWAAIKAASDAGDAANVWSVGDTKSIRLNGKVGNFTFSNQSIDAFIVGFNHNSEKEGGKRTHFAIGKISGNMVALCDNQFGNEQTTSGYFNMNTSRTNSGGWNSSNMRRNILGNTGTPSSPPANTLLAALPSDLRAVMKSVTKYTDNTGNASNTAGAVTATTDYLWLFAEFEVFGQRYYANQYEQNSQVQYAYFSAGNSRIAYRHTATSTAVWWWLRSATYSGSNHFCTVNTDGTCNRDRASWSAGVVAGFAA
jgi:hypothetical protein